MFTFASKKSAMASERLCPFSTEQLHLHLRHLCIFMYLAVQPRIQTTILQEVTLVANNFVHSIWETHSASVLFA